MYLFYIFLPFYLREAAKKLVFLLVCFYAFPKRFRCTLTLPLNFTYPFL